MHLKRWDHCKFSHFFVSKLVNKQSHTFCVLMARSAVVTRCVATPLSLKEIRSEVSVSLAAMGRSFGLKLKWSEDLLLAMVSDASVRFSPGLVASPPTPTLFLRTLHLSQITSTTVCSDTPMSRVFTTANAWASLQRGFALTLLSTWKFIYN